MVEKQVSDVSDNGKVTVEEAIAPKRKLHLIGGIALIVGTMIGKFNELLIIYITWHY